MVMKNQRIAIVYYNEDRSGMNDEVHYADREISEKDFKKWYNHLFKEFYRNRKNADIADMFALYEDHIGETCELANFWGIEYMQRRAYEREV